MPYDLSIPGWMSERNLQVIEHIGRRVPIGGHIVEIGSFCGRSATAWASSAPTATISCIDTWQLTYPRLDSSWRKIGHGDPGRYRGSSEETFREVTHDVANIIARKGRSTDDWQLQAADVVFLDGDHHEASVSAELQHWSSRLAPGGLLCGDDFRSEASWRGVMFAVSKFARRVGYHLFVPAKSTMWMLFQDTQHMERWWSGH
jgi:predicted O-methyltransferase YrrM